MKAPMTFSQPERPLLSAQRVGVSSRGQVLVKPQSLALYAGRCLTIVGETGSGKSLLAQALMGLLPQELEASGTMTLDDRIHDLGASPRQALRPLWGRRVCILPQEPMLALDPTMRALAQVEEGHRLVRGLSTVAARQQALEDLQRLDLAGASAKLPGQLSGGMAQRLAFAAARAAGGSILIADEPTKGLDASRCRDVLALLRQELAEGGALLLITHDLALARALGGEIAVMLEGSIVERAAAEDLFLRPAHAYTRRLIEAEPACWPSALRQGAKRDGKPLIAARDLAKQRGGRRLFSDLSIDIQPGEIIGLSGESGAGKSTLGDILLGLVTPDAGRVERHPDMGRLRFQKIYQDPPAAFAPSQRLGQAMDDVVRRHGLDARQIPPLLKRLRLDAALLTRRTDQVSGGELQRLALLRALLVDPVFLFADEPTSRLDPITQRQIVELMVELARERGLALLFVSHDTALLQAVCDRILPITSEKAAG
ncbi:ABC transporter ATP-binding protein [Allorhizobium undicola]